MIVGFLVVLSTLIPGGVSVSTWSMNASKETEAIRGQDVVLTCSFTHPKQDHYAGNIMVEWSKDSKQSGKPFFACSIQNISSVNLRACSWSRYSLHGDPRQGVLLLLIERVQPNDEGEYSCRIKLDNKNEMEKTMVLKVVEKPEILSLSLVNDSAPQRLQCVTAGNPLPNITWLSTSRGPILAEKEKKEGYRLTSWVPYEVGDRVTCTATSRLGRAERTLQPPSNALTVALIAGGGAVLLLLATGGVVHLLRRREERSLHCTHSPAEGAVDFQAVYSTVVLPVSEESPLHCTHTPAEGAVDIQAVYSTVVLPVSETLPP
ncbi:sialic acid binding Ig-like lectin 15, like isoform X2 [Entelurus aequoreus]|uniref:sialic acid binding Ig-like lectin 15, like isoform X2 n=1 Tax=Entelurus aequoreus TaxID=161455 RepID=UPI002B1DD68D|nr:sialic acid binding Ig-like lectin 15, like isoform X2 [Entelurus aequoreus]